MPLWTFFGLQKGRAATKWPRSGADSGQNGVLGMPRFNVQNCEPHCQECVSACPTSAISMTSDDLNDNRLSVDFGRCIACQLCVETCPTEAISASSDWAFGVRDRSDLVLNTTGAPAAHMHREPALPRDGFRRSLYVRHVDSGSCNGCESELQALNNPFYNLHRFGIFFTPSPRFADLLLVTGPVTHAMYHPLMKTYEAMPEPRWVMAVGTCAVSGALVGGAPTCCNGLEDVLPVDLYLPGSPPNPAAIIEALLMFLDRVPQRVKKGCMHE